MKKITAILVALLLVLAFAACVDNNQGDMDGDVTLPGGAPTAESSSPNKNPTSSGNNNGGIYVDSNGEINLPRDTF